MQTKQYTQLAQERDFEANKQVISSSVGVVVDENVRVLIHRRGEEIHTRIRLIRSRLKTSKERDVFAYICDNTLGRCKASDQIANSQFKNGKRCKKTGNLIDLGWNFLFWGVRQ